MFAVGKMWCRFNRINTSFGWWLFYVLSVLQLLSLVQISLATTSYYCDPELCRIWNGTDYAYVEHIGCDNNGTLSDDCPQDASMMEMTTRRMNLILDLHNAARNRVAMGKVPGYTGAGNMPALKWDYELENLASLNVKTCKFAHDFCRNTAKFQFSGQNIGISWQNPPFHSNSKRIKLIIGLWFNEYKDANQTFIDSYEEHPEGKKIGHFTLLVSDRAKRVGCAAIRYTDGNRGRAFLMTCNYDFTNIYSEPIYHTGKSASNCTLRKSDRYAGLCEWDNVYENSEESSEIDNGLIDILEIL